MQSKLPSGEHTTMHCTTGTKAMPEFIDRREGKHLFGLNPQGYGDARPAYPEAIYQFLVEHRAIGPGTTTLEIGAGNGLAIPRLID